MKIFHCVHKQQQQQHKKGLGSPFVYSGPRVVHPGPQSKVSFSENVSCRSRNGWTEIFRKEKHNPLEQQQQCRQRDPSFGHFYYEIRQDRTPGRTSSRRLWDECSFRVGWQGEGRWNVTMARRWLKEGGFSFRFLFFAVKHFNSAAGKGFMVDDFGTRRQLLECTFIWKGFIFEDA